LGLLSQQSVLYGNCRRKVVVAEIRGWRCM
jgi:hypothetical protein